MKFLFYTCFVVLLESIGGYGGYGETPNAFIFSLNNSEGLAPFMSKVKREYKALAIYRHSDDGPTFGFDGLVIKARMSQSTASLGSSYSVPSSVKDSFAILKGPGTYFSPDKVEVFILTHPAKSVQDNRN